MEPIEYGAASVWLRCVELNLIKTGKNMVTKKERVVAVCVINGLVITGLTTTLFLRIVGRGFYVVE